jgi:outer membrane protein assembly factor BamA
MGRVLRLACLYVLVLACEKASAQSGFGSSQNISADKQAPAADSNHAFVIRNIIITGNRKTNPNIILRELSFGIDEAYSLALITRKFQKARKQLMNTGLFIDVVVSLKNLTGYDIYVNIQVEEKWYVWPQPFIRPVDKTFHQWWSEKDRNMDRINYGLKLTHNNFTGRNDKLKVNIMNGYTKQLSLQYYGLYLDNKLKWSINGGFAVGMNREVNYMTVNNKPVPVKGGDKYLRSYSNWFAEVNYRPAIKTKHTFGISYNYEDFADTIYKLNPSFSSGRNVVRYPELMYRMSYFDVDFIPYPTKGYIGELTLRKKGFNDPLNLWQLTAKASATWPFARNYFFNLRMVGMVKLPFSQPYMTRQFIGYEDQFLQGYEYYVIDGVAGGYTKASISRCILNTHFGIPSQRWKRLNNIPLKIYAKSFVDAGYVYSRHPGQNELTNKFLYSGGVGFDILGFTDFVIKIEWSFNRLGENGLYLHQRNYF